MPLPKPEPGQRKWWWIGGVGIALGVALSIWFGLSMTVGKPSWETFGYSVVSDEEVKVTFDVSQPDGQPVNCTVRALAHDFGTVGSLEVKLPAVASGSGDPIRHTVTVRTTSRAVTGEVRTCRVA